MPKKEKIQKAPAKQRESPCGTSCPDFVAKTCPGSDPKCALYWRFSKGL